MSASTRTQKLPSAFTIERERFRVLFRKFREHWLNEFFDLSLGGPSYRMRWIVGLFIVVALINILANITLILSHLKILLPAVLAPGSVPVDIPKEAIFIITMIAYVCIPFFVTGYYALELAADYLTDIFELKHIDTARTFIQQLSLQGGGHAIRVRGGKIVDSDLESPLIKIGGPGRVVVEFDSAVLFEKPDGTPHVIGPTRRPGATLEEDEDDVIDIAILDGFERFREAIDLRDHYIGNPPGEGMTIKSLSLDGLPVSAADVRAVYSVRRNENKTEKRAPTKEMPYPYSRKAIEDIVYQSSARVLAEGPDPSDQPSVWTSTAQSLIRSTISEFMSENNLSEYLASFGAPEVEQAESQERTIQFQRFEITADASATAKPPDIAQPKFRPRTELSGVFNQVSDRFTKRANERGVDLHWIGVGTWKIPDKIASDIISGQHIQAWQINRENVSRGSEESIKSVFNDAYLDQKLHLIQNVPLATYKQNEKERNKNGVRALMMAYWDLFGEAADLYYNAGDSLPKELEDAIKKIENIIFRDQHYVGNRPTKLRDAPAEVEEKRPPAPSTYNEARLYPKLLRLLNGDYKKSEWLIEYETQKAPGSSREVIIQYLLDHPELCNI